MATPRDRLLSSVGVVMRQHPGPGAAARAGISLSVARIGWAQPILARTTATATLGRLGAGDQARSDNGRIVTHGAAPDDRRV